MKIQLRAKVATTVALLMVGLGLACSQNEPVHDPATQYTAESLSKELVFRFKALDIVQKAPGKGKITAKGKESAERAAGKSKEATKEARVISLDSLIADIATKAALVKNKSVTDVLKSVEQIVSADQTLNDTDKGSIRDSLSRVSN